MKKFTRTTRELPANERIIGGDAPRSAINQERKATIKALIEKVDAEKAKRQDEIKDGE